MKLLTEYWEAALKLHTSRPSSFLILFSGLTFAVLAFEVDPSIESGQIAIEIYDNDSPMTVKIKEFMALYGIVDIKMRMLRIPELKKIMGFPEDYVLIGTQADQKKFIGNAVEVTQARKNTEALCKVLRKLRLKKSKEIA
jgi:hypothetical protein